MCDFVKENSDFLIIVIAAVGASCGGCLAFILKSRCTHISCCGVSIDRDVIPADRVNPDANIIHNMPNNNNV